MTKGLKLADAEADPLAAQGRGYAVSLPRDDGTRHFAIGCKGAPVFVAYRRADAVAFRDELVQHGIRRGKVIRVEWSVREVCP